MPSFLGLMAVNFLIIIFVLVIPSNDRSVVTA